VALRRHLLPCKNSRDYPCGGHRKQAVGLGVANTGRKQQLPISARKLYYRRERGFWYVNWFFPVIAYEGPVAGIELQRVNVFSRGMLVLAHSDPEMEIVCSAHGQCNAG